MNHLHTEVAVVGGGAAGLCAAVACAGNGCHTILLERQNKIGRKLLATGNGRCNISNRNAATEHYHGDQALIDSVIGSFSAADAESFFRSLGVLLREDAEGRLYPYSNQAATILKALQDEAHRLGVTILCDFSPTDLKPAKSGFLLRSQETEISAAHVIMATGSQASPMLGANDSGYLLLQKLGLKPAPLFPALCPVDIKEKLSSLKGIRAKGTVALLTDAKPFRMTCGEIQFTDHGISGICVFELSRYVNEWFCFGKIDGIRVHHLSFSLDLIHEFSFHELLSCLSDWKRRFANRPAEELLTGILHPKLSAFIVRSCGLYSKSCSSLTGSDLKTILHTAKNLRLTPLCCGSFSSAQVSAGGFGSDAVDPSTLSVRNYPHLYLCGEMLNVDGDCGGYNLHFAVGSALRIARHIQHPDKPLSH